MKTSRIYLGMAALAALSISACKNGPDYAAHDAVFKNMDTTIKPGEDFFKYANGGWLKKNPIPAAYQSWGIGNLVNEDIRDRLKKINEDALAAKAEKGTSTQ